MFLLQAASAACSPEEPTPATLACASRSRLRCIVPPVFYAKYFVLSKETQKVLLTFYSSQLLAPATRPIDNTVASSRQPGLLRQCFRSRPLLEPYRDPSPACRVVARLRNLEAVGNQFRERWYKEHSPFPETFKDEST